MDVEPVSSRSAARMLELYWLGFGRASGPSSLWGFQFPAEPPGPDRPLVTLQVCFYKSIKQMFARPLKEFQHYWSQ